MQNIPQPNIHLGLLSALDWFLELAEEHELEYVLDGGCLLGATRNGRFIPWDDDIDLTMSRAEFRRLSDLLQTVAIPAEIEVFTPNQSTHKMANPFSAKIRLRGVRGEEPNLLKRGISLEGMAHSGPAIDIVALDYVPAPKTLAKIVVRCARFVSSVIRLRAVTSPLGPTVSPRFKAVIYLVRLIPTRVIPIANKFFVNLQNRRKSSLVCYSLGDNYPSAILNASDFFPVTTIEFEGRLVSAPGQSQNVLEGLYGKNYMTPPSEKHRVNHFSNLRAIPGEKTYIPGLEND
jgi:lipopolysaccharide cholinephosphotransferase